MIDPDRLEAPIREWHVDPITRWQLMQRFGLGLGAMSTAGWLATCGGSSSKSSGTTGGAAAPKRGGSLVVGSDADAYTLSGNSANVGQYPLNISGLCAVVGISPISASDFSRRTAFPASGRASRRGSDCSNSTSSIQLAPHSP